MYLRDTGMLMYQASVDLAGAGLVPASVQVDAEAVRRAIALFTHELRTPLSSLNASIEVLLSDLSELNPDDALAMLRRMQRSVTWLQSLIENLETCARLDSKRVSLHRAPLRLSDCIETALAVVQPVLDRKSQRVRLSGMQPDLLIQGDRRRIEQILVNLLANASKYSDTGDCIDVHASGKGPWVQVRVTDHGPGIPKEEQSRIFDPFVRGKAGLDHNVTGLGLGLYVVKSLVELHGGTVGLDSDEGQGASFWFTLPRVRQNCKESAGLTLVRARSFAEET